MQDSHSHQASINLLSSITDRKYVKSLDKASIHITLEDTVSEIAEQNKIFVETQIPNSTVGFGNSLNFILLLNRITASGNQFINKLHTAKESSQLISSEY